MAKRVLIVEDSKTQAQRAEFLLRGAGYEVEVAEDGQEGFAKASSNPPDLVVTDIKMPRMDGYEMTSLLKAKKETAHVPVLMLTDQDQPMDVIRGLETGAEHFITKPYEDGDLLRRIQSLFAFHAGDRLSDQELRKFSQDIIITRSREQLLQALLQTSTRVMNCEAMALLLDGHGQTQLFVLAFTRLRPDTVRKLQATTVETLSRLRRTEVRVGRLKTVEIVAQMRAAPVILESDMMRSSLHSALMVKGQVIGLIGVFSSKPRAFATQHVKFLFDMGRKAAAALSRVTAYSR